MRRQEIKIKWSTCISRAMNICVENHSEGKINMVLVISRRFLQGKEWQGEFQA